MNLCGLTTLDFHVGWSMEQWKWYDGSLQASSRPGIFNYDRSPFATTSWSYCIFLPFFKTTVFSPGIIYTTAWPSDVAIYWFIDFLVDPSILNFVILI